MASNPLAQPDPGLADVEKSGRSGLSQALSGTEPIPAAPAPPEEPPPEPVAVPEPAAEPATPAPQPPPEAPPPAQEAAPAPVLDPASFSEDALRALRMEGWQDGQPITQDHVIKLSERYLEFNNRLGKRGEPGPLQATPAEPEPAPVEPVVEAPPPQIALSQEQIDQHVRGAVQQDQEAQGWVEEWKGNTAQINEMSAESEKIENDLSIAAMRLEIPEIKNDDTGIAKAEIQEEIRGLQLRQITLELQLNKRVAANQDLNSQYLEREDNIRGYIRSEVDTQAQVNAFQAQASTEWDAALATVSQRHGLSPEDRNELEDRARDAGIAILDRGQGEIANLEQHIETYAQRIKASQDRHHRQQSAEYGAIKAGGTQPAPAPAPPEAAPAQAPQPGGLDAIYKRTRAALRQGIG